MWTWFLLCRNPPSYTWEKQSHSQVRSLSLGMAPTFGGKFWNAKAWVAAGRSGRCPYWPPLASSGMFSFLSNLCWGTSHCGACLMPTTRWVFSSLCCPQLFGNTPWLLDHRSDRNSISMASGTLRTTALIPCHSLWNRATQPYLPTLKDTAGGPRAALMDFVWYVLIDEKH